MTPSLADPGTWQAAREFTAAHGLRHEEFLDDTGDEPGAPLRGDLAGLLSAPRPADPAWWCDVALGWRASGCPVTGWACADRARHLVEEGVLAGWDVLQRLAGLLAQTTPQPTGPAVPWHLDRESSAAKSRRIGVLFGRGDYTEVNRRVSALAEAENLEGLLFSLRSSSAPDWATAARLWHRSGYYRLVIEQLFARIAGRPLAAWLEQDEAALVWCGWSFHRIGDRSTACACFRLSVALEDADTRRPAPEDPVEVDEEQPAGPSMDAFEYLGRFGREADDAGLDGDLQPVFVHVARLASWLEERGMQGYLPRLVTGPAVRGAALALTMQEVAGRSGWFAPLLPKRSPSNPVLPASGRAAGLPPRHLCDRPKAGDRQVPVAPVAWQRPSRVCARAERTGPEVRVPIGVIDGYGTAELEVRPGERTLMAGIPTAAAVLETVADRLLADGWGILWICQARPAGPAPSAHWHRLESTDHKTDLGTAWLADLTESAQLRQAVTDCLQTLLPVDRDPDGAACVRAAVASLGAGAVAEADQILVSGSAQRLRQHAVRVVDEIAQLTFRGPRDLRRAGVLLGLVTEALFALRRVARTQWKAAAGASPGTGVYLELPADSSLDASLLATVAVGSLLRTAGICSSSPDKIPVGDFVLELRAREELSEEAYAELKAMVEQASSKPPAKSGRKGRPRPQLSGSPWIDRRVITSDNTGRLCVLVCGSFGAGLRSVTAGLRQDGPGRDVGLVTAIATPSEADMPVARDYATLLIGDITADLLAPLGIAAGVQLDPRIFADLGRYGAVRVRVDEDEPPQRLVVWPASDGRR